MLTPTTGPLEITGGEPGSAKAAPLSGTVTWAGAVSLSGAVIPWAGVVSLSGAVIPWAGAVPLSGTVHPWAGAVPLSGAVTWAGAVPLSGAMIPWAVAPAGGTAVGTPVEPGATATGRGWLELV
jgi:hypothetical protein